MAATLGDRVSCSLKAVGLIWLVSGVVFVLAIRGPNTVIAWVIWGTAVFVVGWLLVGLPFVALGDTVLRMSAVPLVLAAGAGGVAVAELPNAIIRILEPATHFVWSVRDLIWPGLAFVIAASSAWLYRILLRSRTAITDDKP